MLRKLKFLVIALCVVVLAALSRFVLSNAIGVNADDSYSTTQLAEATRLEQELLRFRVEASDLVHGYGYATTDTVKLAFDLLSSRAQTEASRPLDRRFTAIGKFHNEIGLLVKRLQVVDPIVQALHEGDIAGLVQVETQLRLSDTAMTEMNNQVYAELSQRSSDVVAYQKDATSRLNKVQWAMLVVGLLAFIMLLNELRVSEKLYQELAIREAEIRGIAARDPLTGLNNRRHFEDQMRRIDDGACSQACHLLMIDLDGFKAINDNNGHEAGDFVLGETARRLIEAVPDSGMIARIGGDEFAVLIDGSSEAAHAAANAILRLLEQPFLFDGKALGIGASIGMAQRRPGRNVAKALQREADLALYEAKAKGRNRACLWKPVKTVVQIPLAVA
jgi:diguanylate cyclase (GGDEF)-like protein